MENEMILFSKKTDKKMIQIRLIFVLSSLAFSFLVFIGFHYLWLLDVEYDGIAYPFYKLAILLFILAIFDVPIFYFSFKFFINYKKYPNATLFRNKEADRLYIYDGKKYLAINPKYIVSVSKKDYSDYYFNYGKRKGIKGITSDLNKMLEIRYKSGTGIKSVTAFVADIGQAEERISAMKEAQNPDKNIEVLGMKKRHANYAYGAILGSLVLGSFLFMWIFLDDVINQWEIDNMYGSAPYPIGSIIGIIVGCSIAAILFVIIYLIYYLKHRYTPSVLYYIDNNTKDRYLFFNGKYNRIPASDFIKDEFKQSRNIYSGFTKTGPTSIRYYSYNTSLPFGRTIVTYKVNGKEVTKSFTSRLPEALTSYLSNPDLDKESM